LSGRSGIEITPVNGDVDTAAAFGLTKSSGKGSKLESALDRLGLQKRKVLSEIHTLYKCFVPDVVFFHS
jgi:hypothetical protein